MTAEPAGPPSFEDVLARGQEFLAQLATLYQGMAREQADQQKKLEALRGAQQQWTGERARLIKDAERLRQEEDAVRADNAALKANQKSYESRLADLQQQAEQLEALHAHVTQQTTKLAAEWIARRDALAADNQRLTAEMAEVRGTLYLSLDREKQWKAQVWKLQDAVRTLRGAAGLVSLTAEQSHHLASQLNAITGFAEVLLDEAGNRATGDERQEFLQHIKESGAHLADYVRQLSTGPKDEGPPAQTAEISPPIEAPHSPAPTVLVAASDLALRERVESFLRRDGYQIEFAGDGEDALRMAARLQPLAMMIDAELAPAGGQDLIDQLAGEARTKDIPVVLLARNDQEHQGLSSGRYDFLSKPINRQQLMQMMDKYELLADRRRASKMPASVLVVDDDSRNTRLVEAMLKPFNINVLVARDGAAGIKLGLARKPDLIILDLMMPGVDGFEVVAALRKDAVAAQVPILIYTAKTITAADRERLQGSIQSLIRKGEISKEQFLELIYRRGERRKRPPAAEPAA
ncbi:MAG: response regulator [Chloroflexi bacterium]|nr:MAG: response regulator [Chloroflexota bacterium]